MTQVAMQNGKVNDGVSKQPWSGKQTLDSKGPFSNAKGQAKRTLLMKKAIKWYKQRLVDVKKKKDPKESLSRDQITLLRTEALSLLKTDYFAYEEQKANKSNQRDDHEWISTVLSSGTVSDKLAAHTVLLQDSAVHNLRSVDQLLRFVNTKGKRECVMAIDNLRDLFVGDLLIPTEKLHTFEDLVNSVDQKWLLAGANSAKKQPGDWERFLIISHVEDQIRAAYKKFLDALVTVSHDNLEALKMKSLKTMFDLFVNNPEQEKYLLSCIINKLGDPTPKVASQTAHLLSQVLSQHPQMKLVIVKEVERLMFRPHITPRTEYYCLCFLSEMVFTTSLDQELANFMINIYFTIFNKCIKQGEINNKTMSTLLTGVSRAFPYSKLELTYLQNYLTTFYRILHFVNLNTGIQTLSLIFNLVNFNESGSLTDRFYVTLYRFVANPAIDHCTKSNLLLNVIYRSIKKDPIIKRVRAFVKRLFQVALLSSSAFVISVLVLVSETIKAKDGFKLESNVLSGHTTAGGEEVKSEDEDDDLEVYYDLDEDGKKEVKPKKADSKEGIAGGSKASWVFLNNSTDGTVTESKEKTKTKSTSYDIDARNPMYANADRDELWELALINDHFHPTAKLFSGKIRSGEAIEYDGNPLDDFTVKRFLDRFVFRNPKQNVRNTREKSTNVRTRIFGRDQDKTGERVMGEHELVEQPEAAIPVDEQFIYRFLKQKKSLRLTERNRDEGDDSDIESVNSLEFNDMLDNYEDYALDDGVEEIDFAKNYQETTSKSKKGKKKKGDGEEEDGEDSIDEDEADFDEEFDDDDMLDGSDLDDDDEAVDMSGGDDDDDDGEGDIDEDIFGGGASDDDDDFADLGLSKGGKKANKARNAAPFAGKKGFSKITNDIFADAEEFAHLLEENEESDSDFDDLEAGGGGDDGASGGSKKAKGKGAKGKGKKGATSGGPGGKKRIHRPSLGRRAALRKKKPRMSADL